MFWKQGAMYHSFKYIFFGRVFSSYWDQVNTRGLPIYYKFDTYFGSNYTSTLIKLPKCSYTKTSLTSISLYIFYSHSIYNESVNYFWKINALIQY